MCDDVLYSLILGRLLCGDAFGQVWGKFSLDLKLSNHLLVHLERVDLKVKILELDEGVDAVLQDNLEVTLTGSSPGICSHHARDWSVGAQKRAVVWCTIELIRKY